MFVKNSSGRVSHSCLPFRLSFISVYKSSQPSSQTPASSWRSKDSSFRPVLLGLSCTAPFKLIFTHNTMSPLNVHTEYKVFFSYIFHYCFCSNRVSFFLRKLYSSLLWQDGNEESERKPVLSFLSLSSLCPSPLRSPSLMLVPCY